MFAKKQAKINYKVVDEVYRYIIQKKIEHPEIVLHQALIETRWLIGDYLMERNNLFNFRKRKYMGFKNWKASVDYYKKMAIKTI